MKQFLSLIAFTLIFSQLSAQENPDLIQFSGVLVSSDSLDQVSYASVVDKTTGKGTMSDYYGYFSFVTRPGDTILFNAFGFKPSPYIVPDTLSEKRYSIIHVMTPDTMELPQVDIYPWPSREEFARAFVEMDPYDDALRRAQRQLSGESLAFAAAKVPTDGSLSYNWATQQRQTQLYTQGQTPVNNLLNPAAWSKFIESWKNGDFQRE
ncbi:MAG: hypothetical protein ACQERC_00245 [Bacteroidota bacterium]